MHERSGGSIITWSIYYNLLHLAIFQARHRLHEAKALDHSIYTEADTLEELKGAVKDAVKAHFEDKDMPSLIRLHMVKDEVIAV